MSSFADILLPLAQPLYTFAVPEGMALSEGMAVAVPFGRGGGKYYTGIVWRLHDRAPAVRHVKSIGKILYDGRLLVGEPQRLLWEWVADYYMCTPGEVMRVALPSLMKPSARGAAGFEEREYRPRTERYLIPDETLADEGRLDELFEGLARRAPKQYDALLEIVVPCPGGWSGPRCRCCMRWSERGSSASRSASGVRSPPVRLPFRPRC